APDRTRSPFGLRLVAVPAHRGRPVLEHRAPAHPAVDAAVRAVGRFAAAAPLLVGERRARPAVPDVQPAGAGLAVFAGHRALRAGGDLAAPGIRMIAHRP